MRLNHVVALMLAMSVLPGADPTHSVAVLPLPVLSPGEAPGDNHAAGRISANGQWVVFTTLVGNDLDTARGWRRSRATGTTTALTLPAAPAGLVSVELHGVADDGTVGGQAALAGDAAGDIYTLCSSTGAGSVLAAATFDHGSIEQVAADGTLCGYLVPGGGTLAGDYGNIRGFYRAPGSVPVVEFSGTAFDAKLNYLSSIVRSGDGTTTWSGGGIIPVTSTGSAVSDMDPMWTVIGSGIPQLITLPPGMVADRDPLRQGPWFPGGVQVIEDGSAVLNARIANAGTVHRRALRVAPGQTAAQAIPIPGSGRIGFTATQVEALASALLTGDSEATTLCLASNGSDGGGSTRQEYFQWHPTRGFVSLVVLPAGFAAATGSGSFTLDGLSRRGEVVLTRSGTMAPCVAVLSPLAYVDVSLDTTGFISETSTAPIIATATRTGSEATLALPLTVTLNFSSGTATYGNDFNGPASIIIPAGATSASVQFLVDDDTEIEGSETLVVAPATPDFATVYTPGQTYLAGSSGSVTVTSNDAEPTLLLVRGGMGTIRAGDSESLTITCSEAVTGLADDDLQASAGSFAPLTGSGNAYAVTWTPPASQEGIAVISLPAGAATGQLTLSPTLAGNDLSIPFDTLVPGAPTISNPAGGSVGGTFTANGTIDLPQTTQVTVTIAGRSQAAVISGSTWSVNLTAIPSGSRTMTVIARDDAGNASVGATKALMIDNSPPSLVIDPVTTPTADPTPTLTGTTNDASATVTLDAGSGITATGTNTGGIWSVTAPPLSDGPRTITIAVSDALGNSTSRTTDVLVDTTPPQVDLAILGDLPIRRSASVAIPVTWSDVLTAVTVTGVSADIVVSGGVTVTSATLSVTGVTGSLIIQGFSGDGVVTIGLAAGTAHDAVGNVAAASTTVQIVVDGTPPASAVITQAGDGSSATPTITGSAETDALVTVREGSAVLGSVTASGGAFAIITSALAPGSHALVIEVRDAAGNVSDPTAVTVSVPGGGSTPGGSSAGGGGGCGLGGSLALLLFPFLVTRRLRRP